jgi:hypothetical protein
MPSTLVAGGVSQIGGVKARAPIETTGTREHEMPFPVREHRTTKGYKIIMRYIKMLGLAAVAATAFMALVGVGSAMASGSTTLCKVNELPCASGNQYASGTVIEGKASNVTLLSNIGNVVCTTSNTSLKTTGAALAAPLTGEITALTFASCTFNGLSCTVTSVHTPYSASLLHTASTMNGTLTVKSSGAGEPGATVSCPGLKCVFGAEPTLTVDGATGTTAATAARVLASEVPLTIKTEEGFLECPETAKWDATYVDTTPTTPIYVSE